MPYPKKFMSEHGNGKAEEGSNDITVPEPNKPTQDGESLVDEQVGREAGSRSGHGSETSSKVGRIFSAPAIFNDLTF